MHWYPATREAKAEGLLEPRSLRPRLGNTVRPHLKKVKKKKLKTMISLAFQT
jgi:hypothetical protein